MEMTMKIKILTLLFVPLLAVSTAQAFAQAGEGDANVVGSGGSYAARGFSSAYGAVIHTGRIHHHGSRKSDHRD
jgi:hypothetical protein